MSTRSSFRQYNIITGRMLEKRSREDICKEWRRICEKRAACTSRPSSVPGLYAQTRRCRRSNPTPIIHHAVPHYPSGLLRVYNHRRIFFVVRVPCMYSDFIGLAPGDWVCNFEVVVCGCTSLLCFTTPSRISHGGIQQPSCDDPHVDATQQRMALQAAFSQL